METGQELSLPLARSSTKSPPTLRSPRLRCVTGAIAALTVLGTGFAYLGFFYPSEGSDPNTPAKFESMPNCSVVFVLGGSIKQLPSTLAWTPNHESTSRVCAFSNFNQVRPNHNTAPLPCVMSGGHNVVVRYNASGSILPANFTFSAFATGADLPSEARVMKDYATSQLGISADSIMLEEVSATTQENAEMAGVILQRTNFLQPGPVHVPLSVCYLTNLHVMEKTIAIFKSVPSLSKHTLHPIYAEDYLLSSPSDHTWDSLILGAYGSSLGSQMLAVMQARAGGNYSVSVADLVPPSS